MINWTLNVIKRKPFACIFRKLSQKKVALFLLINKTPFSNYLQKILFLTFLSLPKVNLGSSVIYKSLRYRSLTEKNISCKKCVLGKNLTNKMRGYVSFLYRIVC